MSNPNRNPANRPPKANDPFEGLSESEKQALRNAAGSNDSARGPDDLMARAYAKSGIDPLTAAAIRDPKRRMAKAQGPILAIGGLLLAAVGVWRIWNAWNYSAISIGGIAMLVIGLIGLFGGLAGTIYLSDEE